MKPPVRTIFFDAGNTLLFPSQERTLAPLARRGISAPQEALRAAERAAKRLQDALAVGSGSVDHGFWELFYQHLLEELGCPDPELRSALVQEIRKATNWGTLAPGTREALLRMRQHCRLGVISNSDGTIRKAFEAVNLADCFDAFVDSALVGYEKPDARIFLAALESLPTAAGETLYVGDIYSVDFAGATRVGMQAVLLDACGAYTDRDLPRVGSLPELEAFLGGAAAAARGGV